MFSNPEMCKGSNYSGGMMKRKFLENRVQSVVEYSRANWRDIKQLNENFDRLLTVVEQLATISAKSKEEVDKLRADLDLLRGCHHSAGYQVDRLRADLDLLRGCHHSAINQLEALQRDFKQFKCQVETHHQNLRFKERVKKSNKLGWVYRFECPDCGLVIEKVAHELTTKDREALIALGLLEV